MFPRSIFLLGVVFSSFLSTTYAQSYDDGPITVDVKLREVQASFAATDESLLGIGFGPDELSFYIWAQDNLLTYPWTGGACLQDLNFTPTIGGSNSIDFNSVFANFNFPTATVPQYLDFRIDAWEDDIPSDGLNLGPLGGFCNQGQACDWNDNVCCGFILFGFCAGLETGDDYRCDANPFYQGLSYRSGPPCQWYDHGYLNGTGCVNPSTQAAAPSNTNGYYKPHIETYWRYTKGTSFANAIDLGSLNSGIPLAHYNSNECYTDYYTASSGNDVIYSFDIINPSGVDISLCGINGAQFDSYLYLVSDLDTNVVMDFNDNSCGGLQSQILTSLCTPGTYYVIVDATAASEFGTFTLEINEDPTSTFSVTDSISDYNGEDISCYGGSDGKIFAHVNGGTPPYTFMWSNGLTNNTLNNNDSIVNLSVSPTPTYSVIVSDSKGCLLPPLSVTLNEPSEVTVLTTSVSASCAGYSDGTITVTNTSGGVPSYSYSWNTIPLQTGTNATSLSAGTYTLTVTDDNGCSISHQDIVNEPAAPSMNITSANAPFSINPLTFEVCDGNNITLTATPGFVSYSWSPNIWLNTNSGSTVISTPNSPGMTYTCTGTDVSGCTVDIPVIVDVVSSVNIYSSNPSPEVCEGEDVTVTFYGASTYSWFPPTYLNTTSGSTVTITPQDSITYTITAQNASGCTDATQFFVDILPAPTINTVSPVSSICYGSSVSITASGANSYSWSPASSLNVSTGSVVMSSPTTTTTYKVVGTALNGCKDSISTTISVIPLPVLNVTGTNSICEGESTSLLVNSNSIISSYVWTPSNSLDTSSGNIVLANPSTSQTYTITGTDLNQCEGTIPFTVSVLPAPNVSITASEDTICIGNASILMANGAVSYNWTPSSSLNINTGVSVTASPTITTTYSVLGTSTNNCSALDTIMIHVDSLPVLSVSPIVSTICEGDSIGITASGAQDFLWSPALGLNTTLGSAVIANPITNSYYTVTGTDINGCSAVISSTVNVNPKPIISLSSIPNTNDICEGASIDINAFGGVSYVWTPSFGLNTTIGPSVIASPSSSTSYTVTGTDVNSCINSANFQLNVGVNPTVSITPKNPVICEGESISLSATGANTYIWIPSNTLTSSIGAMVNANPLISTTYTLLGTDILGCEGIDSTTVSVNPLPTASITQDSLKICAGDLAAIAVETSGTPPWDLSYAINGSLQETLLDAISSPIIISSDIAGEYTLISITDDNECSNIGNGSLFLDVLNMPIADFVSYGPDGSSDLDILQPEVSFINTSSSSSTYSWYFGDHPLQGSSNLINPIYTYSDPGNYPVILVANNGPCSDDTIKNILIKPVYTLWIPNSFSPNNDGTNDYFPWDCQDPTAMSIKEFEMYIYNSWGEEVFHTEDQNDCWNGRINQNGEVILGYYSYLIKIYDELGVRHTVTGKVLLN